MNAFAQMPLAEVCTIVGGGTPRRDNAAYFGGTIPWATPTDVTPLDSLFIEYTKETITETGLKESSARLVPAGTVLMTSRATIGYTAIARRPMATNQGFANLICGDKVEPEYLAYWLRDQRERLVQLAGGTTFRELPKSTLKKVRILLPPLDEQRRIVSILNRAAKAERLRARARDVMGEFAPALFLKMFGDPIENPMGWKTASLGKLIEGFEGGRNLKEGNGASRFRILKVSAVTGGEFDPSMSKPAPDDYVPPHHHCVCGGDLLISRANGTSSLVGATVMVESEVSDILLPDKIWRFVWRNNSLIEPWFLHGLFRNSSFRHRMAEMATGTSGAKNISQAKLKTLPIVVPPLDLQRLYTQLTTAARSMEETISISADAASSLSSALIPRLLVATA